MFFISLFPASMPAVVIFGPLVITKPVASKVFPPTFARSSVISLARSNFILLSFSPFVIFRFVLPAAKSTVPPMLTSVALAPPTESFQPCAAKALNAFNCATLTASVSRVPAAIPVICRVFQSLASPVITPTLTAPKSGEDFHITFVCVVFFPVIGS
ncbi:Uncharacterised protein [Candidatus Bartonella washoeensis]|nr:Uncharacterised protein [Bartonella washoeensis]